MKWVNICRALRITPAYSKLCVLTMWRLLLHQVSAYASPAQRCLNSWRIIRMNGEYAASWGMCFEGDSLLWCRDSTCAGNVFLWKECPFILVTTRMVPTSPHPPPFLFPWSVSCRTHCCLVFPLPTPAHTNSGWVFGDRHLETCRVRHGKEKSYLTTISSLFLCLSMDFLGSIHSISISSSHLYQNTEEKLLTVSILSVCVCFNFTFREERNTVKKGQGRRDYLFQLPFCFHCSY